MKENKDVLLSARFTTEEHTKLKEILAQSEEYGSMSEVIHALTKLGIRHLIIKKEMEDPLFVNAMEEQFHLQINVPKIEETFKRLKVTDMDAMMAKLGDIREKKFNSLIKV